MTRIWRAAHRWTRQHWHGAVMLSTLAALALIAPHVNAASKPPSAIFAQWPADRAAPDLRLVASQDADGAWSLDVDAQGFAFTDLCQTVEGPQTIGHAHLYSGERKIAGVYVPMVYLGHLVPGRHSFRVVLRAQDHRALVGPNGLIAATITITVP